MHRQQVMIFLPRLGEEHQFHVPLDVFNRGKAHGLSSFGLVMAEAGDHARHPHLFLVVRLGKLGGEMRYLAAQRFGMA